MKLLKLPVDIKITVMPADLMWKTCDYGVNDSSGREVNHECQSVQYDWAPLFPEFNRLLTSCGLNDYRLDQYEILQYGANSHLMTHSDRWRGPGHLGTLLLIFPSKDIVGGDLIIGSDVIKSGLVYIPLETQHSISVGDSTIFKVSVFHRQPLASKHDYQIAP